MLSSPTHLWAWSPRPAPAPLHLSLPCGMPLWSRDSSKQALLFWEKATSPNFAVSSKLVLPTRLAFTYLPPLEETLIGNLSDLTTRPSDGAHTAARHCPLTDGKVSKRKTNPGVEGPRQDLPSASELALLLLVLAPRQEDPTFSRPVSTGSMV